MKFVSKSTNLYVILKPGLPAVPMTGTPAVPTISVRFMDGIAKVDDEGLVKMMLAHPGYNVDFISVDEDGADPYKFQRQDAEPAHVLTDMKYGMPSARTVGNQKNPLPPEAMKLVTELASQMVKDMLPGALAAALPGAVAEATKAMKEIQTEEIAKEVLEETLEELVETPVEETKEKTTKKNTAK